MAASLKTRLLWIDHLRTFVILLVVNMHACVTYGHVGDWYYMADHEPALGVKLLFLFWQAHLQSFFMGVLFFFAGYFAFGALGRRGRVGFIRERLWRLGAPTLFYMLAIQPFILLGINPWHRRFAPFGQFYPHYLFKGVFLGSSGPMWFAFALLIFSLIWALLGDARPQGGLTRPAGNSNAPGDGVPPKGRRLFWFGLSLGCATFLVRLYQPLGTSILNFQLGYFAQYVAAFLVGLSAARHGWLVALAASPAARRAGWLGLIGGPIALFTLLFVLQRQGVAEAQYLGGWNLPALGLAVWEQLTGVALALGAMFACARYFNRDSAILQWMSDRSFGVYLFHPPILIALTVAFRSLPPHPILQTALLTVTALVGSFLFSDLVRRIPGARSLV